MTEAENSHGREELLVVKNINVTYRGKGFRGPQFRALTDVSIDVARGETLGLVGESGSGKTTLGRALLGLVPIGSGSVRFDGDELAQLKARERRRREPDIQVVFQDPYSSLNPALTVEAILSEPLTVRGHSRSDARRRVRDLLDQVQLAAGAERRYPREFSGGQRQRIAIARALALGPKLVICDEPVSALDMSTQAKILDLFIEIQERTGVAYLFISHDISVVRYISHRVAVMLQGEIIETGDGGDITSSPSHAYTKRLLLASPVPDPARQAVRRNQYMTLN
jgi:ABC-type glutathione transport system ATPase component